MEIGDRIGRTLRVDLNTFSSSDDEHKVKVERGQFARLYVEINLQKKLVKKVICSIALFNIEYEGL